MDIVEILTHVSLFHLVARRLHIKSRVSLTNVQDPDTNFCLLNAPQLLSFAATSSIQLNYHNIFWYAASDPSGLRQYK